MLMFQTTMYRQIVFVLSLKKFYFLIFFTPPWGKHIWFKVITIKWKLIVDSIHCAWKEKKLKKRMGKYSHYKTKLFIFFSLDTTHYDWKVSRGFLDHLFSLKKNSVMLCFQFFFNFCFFYIFICDLKLWCSQTLSLFLCKTHCISRLINGCYLSN